MNINKSIMRRCTWSILLILIVEVGKKIDVPGFMTIIDNRPKNLILHYLSTATGGNLLKPTLFSLGMGPYMTALIVWTTITMADIDVINNLSAKKRGYFQRALTFLFAIIQGVTILFKFKKWIDYKKFIGTNKTLIFLVILLILITGAMLISWLSDINSEKGIGGQSLFILPGLISNLPSMLVSGQKGALNFKFEYILVLIVITIIYIYITMFLYNSEYRIYITRTSIDSRFNNSYIPIRLLTAGAMPFMFAVTIFSMPQLLLLNNSFENTFFSKLLTQFFSFNSIKGIIVYAIILFLLGMGFSQINVRPHDIAKNLKESGDYIYEVVPGKKTELYIKNKLLIISMMGSFYLVIISVIPLLIGLKFPLIGNLAFYFGSVFMLIIILDTLIQEFRFIFSKRDYNIFDF